MERFTNLNEFKSERQVVQFIKENFSNFLYEYCKETFGEEFCRYIPEKITITENEADIPANTVVVDIGDILTKDNFTSGVCCEIGLKVKKWNTSTRKNGGKTYAVTLDDYDEGLEVLKETEEKQ